MAGAQVRAAAAGGSSRCRERARHGPWSRPGAGHRDRRQPRRTGHGLSTDVLSRTPAPTHGWGDVAVLDTDGRPRAPTTSGTSGSPAGAVLTNTTPVVAYRGAGRPEATAAIERAMDLFAAEVGLDPVEMPSTQPHQAGGVPVRQCHGCHVRQRELPACARPRGGGSPATTDSGSSRVRGARAAARPPAGHRCERSTWRSPTARRESEFGGVEAPDDGRLSVLTGTFPQGQGHATTWAMLVSEQTRHPDRPDRCGVRRHGPGPAWRRHVRLPVVAGGRRRRPGGSSRAGGPGA